MKVSDNSFKKEWIEQQRRSIRLAIPAEEVSDEDLAKFLEEKYQTANIRTGRLFNNFNNKVYSFTAEQFIDKVLSTDCILSGASTFFKNQHEIEAIPSGAIRNLLRLRKAFKSKKFECAKIGDTDGENYYNRLQLTYKILVNSYYGVTGKSGSIFNNRYCQNSTTLTGRDAITSTIMVMEEFLANNIYFFDASDVLTYIRNIVDEHTELNILDVIDYPANLEETAQYLYGKIEVPEPGYLELITKALSGLSSEMLSRVFYKNNYLKILEHTWFKESFEELSKMELLDPNSVPEEVEAKLCRVRERVLAHVYYPHISEARFNRAYTAKRKAVIITATDSNFICVDPYVKYVEKHFALDMRDKKRRISVINMFVNIMTSVMANTFGLLTKNLNVPDEHRNTLFMKNEFVYSRILNTSGKNMYAGAIICQEGNVYDKTRYDVKGFGFKKAITGKNVGERWSEILESKVLNSDVLDICEILNDTTAFAKEMADSLRRGELTYSRPMSVEPAGRYDTPLSVMQWRGTETWNLLMPTQAISPPVRVNLLVLKTNDPKYALSPEMERLKETEPEIYRKLIDYVFQTTLPPERRDQRGVKFGFDVICVPKNVDKIPDWLIPFVDADEMAAYNINSGMAILKSLGVLCYEPGSSSRNARPTNIVAI